MPFAIINNNKIIISVTTTVAPRNPAQQCPETIRYGQEPYLYTSLMPFPIVAPNVTMKG
jgi:hypothetical protein